MGRTKRKRNKNKLDLDTENNNDAMVELQKWMGENKWKNITKLKIKYFPQTGRGVTSSRTINKNDLLITVPYDLMITLTTIQTNLLEKKLTLKEKLTIHDLLALFLYLEHDNPASKYKFYIQSLPSILPHLPWLQPEIIINLFPSDLRESCLKNLEKFKNSSERASRSILGHRVLEVNLFKWAYVMVNTRAVYVNPDFVLRTFPSHKDNRFLLDKPSYALCPFLDMFNHHHDAETEAELTGDCYQLRSSVGFKKNQQIFISYGSHDNEFLLMQYGFFVPGNKFDTVNYSFKEILTFLNFNLNKEIFNFITSHNLDKNLNVSLDGSSFNLKAVLFCCNSNECNNLKSVVFGDGYSENFTKILKSFLDVLLRRKKEMLVQDYERMKSVFNDTDTVLNYVMYKIEFIDCLLNKIPYFNE